MSCLSFAVLFSSENSFRLDQMDLKIWSFTIYITSLTFSLWLFWTVLKIASTRGSSRSVEQHVKAYPSATQHPAKRISLSRQSSGTVQSEKWHAGQCFSLDFLWVVCLSPESHPMLRLLPMDWNWCLVLLVIVLQALFSFFRQDTSSKAQISRCFSGLRPSAWCAHSFRHSWRLG